MTVVMKVDLATPRTFGLVIGWNEFAGYTGMAATAALTGVLATSFGLEASPFALGVAMALIGLGTGPSQLRIRSPPQIRHQEHGPSRWVKH